MFCESDGIACQQELIVTVETWSWSWTRTSYRRVNTMTMTLANYFTFTSVLLDANIKLDLIIIID